MRGYPSAGERGSRWAVGAGLVLLVAVAVVLRVVLSGWWSGSWP